MIRQVKLRHWGIFRTEWQSPALHDLVDLLGQNGTGKSTLIDGISVALGLTRQSYLFENRSVGAYVNEGREAIIALLLDNQPDANGNRRFKHLNSDKVTAAAKICPKESPMATFTLREGDISLRNLAELKREWMTNRDYEALWRKAHLPQQQRLQRIFRVHDIKRVEKSKSSDLDDLFREYCSNPKIAEDLRDAEANSRSTAKNIKNLEDKKQEVSRERRIKYEEFRAAESLKRDFEACRFAEGQYRVAKFNELRNEHQKVLDAMSKAEKEREQHEAALIKLEGRLANAEKLAARAQLAADEQAKKKDRAKTRADELRGIAAEASKEEGRIEAEQREYTQLHASCRPRKKVEAELAKAETEYQQVTAKLMQAEQMLDSLRERIGILRDTGLSPEVVVCLNALTDAKIKFAEARNILPSDNPQGYEEAVNRSRFGLLVSKKDAEAAIDIARRHRYPGPISTLNEEQYVQAVAVEAASTDGFSMAVGQFVVQGDDPVLNPALREELIERLGQSEADLLVETRRFEKQTEGIETTRGELNAELGRVRRLEALEPKRSEWATMLQQANERKDEADQAGNELIDIAEKAAATQQEATRLSNDEAKARKALEDEQAHEPDQLQSKSTALLEDVAEAEEQAEPFMDRIGTNYQASSDHKKTWEDWQDKLRDEDEPTKAALEGMERQVEFHGEDLARREEEIKEQESELRDSQAKVQRLQVELEANEASEFRSFQKRVETLGAKYGVICEAKRSKDPKNPGKYFLEFKVSNRQDLEGNPTMESISKSSSSTGENTKACIVFMMALTPDTTKSFYIFDEPAAAFSEENLEDMWQIFREMGHQVIITSTKPGDYGEDDVDIQLMRLRAEPKNTPNRKALGCEQYNAVFGKESFQVAV